MTDRANDAHARTAPAPPQWQPAAEPRTRSVPGPTPRAVDEGAPDSWETDGGQGAAPADVPGRDARGGGPPDAPTERSHGDDSNHLSIHTTTRSSSR
jgi:hypothetical protein